MIVLKIDLSREKFIFHKLVMKLFLLFFVVLVESKECPAEIPIPAGESSCNTTLNPTGQTEDDPPCYYDNCDRDESAVCGCVDFSLFGGSGMFWGCIHSRCECANSIENDVCGIHGSDFQNPDFVGEAPVSGEGCVLGDRTGCLCKPVL